MDYDTEIDLSGLTCPVPILKTKAALAAMRSGEVLKIIVTNSDSVREIRIYAKQTGSTLREVLDEGGANIMLFKKG